jgi:hypothetical protein
MKLGIQLGTGLPFLPGESRASRTFNCFVTWVGDLFSGEISRWARGFVIHAEFPLP